MSGAVPTTRASMFDQSVGFEPALVGMQDHLHARGARHHVRVGDDVAVNVDDRARSDASSRSDDQSGFLPFALSIHRAIASHEDLHDRARDAIRQVFDGRVQVAQDGEGRRWHADRLLIDRSRHGARKPHRRWPARCERIGHQPASVA